MKLDGDDHLPAKGEESPSAWEGGGMKWQSDGSKKLSIRRTILVAALVSLVVGTLTTLTAFTAMSRWTSSSSSPPVVSLTAPLANGHPGMPKEYVEEVMALVYYTGAQPPPPPPPPLNSTRQLEKRQAAAPDAPACEDGQRFVRRRCDPSRSRSAWVDVCTDGRTETVAPVLNSCPTGEFCADHVDGKPGHGVVVCRPTAPPEDDGKDLTAEGGHKGSQYGFIRIPRRNDGDPAEFTWSVTVQKDMGDASITAYLIDDQTKQAVEPSYTLVGHIRGLQRPFCSGGRGTPECIPLNRRDLKVKEQVDFTFGRSFGEDRTLFYSLWGWHG